MAVVSVSMPDKLLECLDSFAREHGDTGRSGVVPEASRNLLNEFEDKQQEDRDLRSVVTVLFNYESTDAEHKMMTLRHDSGLSVTSHVYNHIGNHCCMSCSSWRGDSTISRRSSGRVVRQGTHTLSITR